MADRTVSVNFVALVQGFTSGVQKMKTEVRTMRSEVATASRQNAAEMQTVGMAAAGMGVAIGAGFAASAKAAIDFESSFAGVRKTVDASEAEFARLSEGFRGLAREIPISVNELNGIGEAAGQLGIAKENILEFTATMADLGVATNMTAETAATEFARFANITQMPQENFDRLGSTVVDLGNNLATTEAEISAFGLRLAGAGSQIGMTEAEILGLGGALSSVGINAEAGGTAVSKVMIDMAKSVSEGGEQLGLFADVAGMTAHQFATAFSEDPANALAAFIEGLGQVDAAGGDLFATLEELGITEQRMRDAMLRTANAGTLVADSMRRGNQAWAENTALTDEAAQRYQTLESRLTLAKNAVTDAAISVGQTLTPALGFAADAATGLAGGLADMPPVVQGTTAVFGGLAGSVSLAAGGFLLAAPRIVATRDALNSLSTTMPATVAALRRVGTMLTGPWGIALAGAITAVGIFASVKGEARRRSEEFAATLDVETGALTENSRAHVAAELSKQGLIDIGREFGLGVETLVDAMLGEEDALRRVAAATEDNRVSHENWGGTAEGAASSGGRLLRILEQVGGEHVATAADARELAVAQAEAEGRFLDTAHAIESGLDPALASLAVQHQKAGDAAGDSVGPLGEHGEALDDNATSAEEAADKLQTYIDTQRAAVDPVFALTSALSGVEDAQRDYDDAVAEHGATSDEARDAAIGQMQALTDLESAAMDGDLAFGAFEDKLAEWVREGRLTAEQADIIGERVAEARGEAEDFESRYTAEMALARWKETGEGINDLRARAWALEDDGPYTAEFDADTGQAMSQIGDLADAIAGLPSELKINATAQLGGLTAGINAWGDGPGRGGPALARVQSAMSGLPGLRVSSTYRTPAQNAAAGGSPTSYHLDRSNPAVDIAGPTSSLDAVAARLRRTPHRELLWRVPNHAPGDNPHVHYANRGMRVPGSGNTDSVPAMLTPREWVINADAVDYYGDGLFADLNAMRLNKGGPVGLASGGYDVSALFAMTRGPSGQGADAHLRSIERMRDAYAEMDRLLDDIEQTKRRQALVDREAAAAAEVRAAEDAEARDRARESLEDAREALTDFDREARLAAERRTIEARIAQAEANQRITANREAWEFDRMTSAEQVARLDRQLLAHRRYTDEWIRLSEQRQAILQAEVDAAVRAYDDELAGLNQMLDERERILDQQAAGEAQYAKQTSEERSQYAKRAAEAEERHAAQVAEARSQHAEQAAAAEKRYLAEVAAAEERYADQVATARQRASDAIQSTVDARRDELRQATSSNFGGWDWTASTITEELDRQTSRLTDWSGALGQARDRGVSQDVVDLLGLDRSPEALNQLLRLIQAGDREIERLNEAAAARSTAIDEQVTDERVDTASELHRDLADIEADLGDELATMRAEHLTQLSDLEAEHRTSQQEASAAHRQMLTEMETARQQERETAQQEHQARLVELEKQFHAEQQALGEQLAAIGADNGRSYAEAIAAGIASGIPAIEAQVAKVKRLMREMKAAESAAGGSSGGSGSSGGGGDALERALAGSSIRSIRERQLAAGGSTRDFALKQLGLDPKLYDVGGILSPGMTLAYNGTGRDEYVMTAQQLQAVTGSTAAQAAPVDMSETNTLLRRLAHAAESGQVVVMDGHKVASLVSRRQGTS